jgi:hypothetical protein
LKQTYESRNLGGSIFLAAADLYFNFSPLVIVGSISGGISILKPERSASDNQPFFFLWPNPAMATDKFFVRANQSSSVQFFSIVGQPLGDSFSLEPNVTDVISHTLSPGLYIARVSFKSQTISYKFIIR